MYGCICPIQPHNCTPCHTARIPDETWMPAIHHRASIGCAPAQDAYFFMTEYFADKIKISVEGQIPNIFNRHNANEIPVRLSILMDKINHK